MVALEGKEIAGVIMDDYSEAEARVMVILDETSKMTPEMWTLIPIQPYQQSFLDHLDRFNHLTKEQVVKPRGHQQGPPNRREHWKRK